MMNYSSIRTAVHTIVYTSLFFGELFNIWSVFGFVKNVPMNSILNVTALARWKERGMKGRKEECRRRKEFGRRKEEGGRRNGRKEEWKEGRENGSKDE